MTQTSAFALPDPSYEGYTWTLQDEHNPASHTPLIASAVPVTRAGDDLDGPPMSLTINGYNYAPDAANTGGTPSPFETIAALNRWRT